MNDERKTPRWLFDLANEAFRFTIDLAASPINALVDRYYTKEDSAFAHDWTGETGWCNPPYSHGNLNRFVDKALMEVDLRADKPTILMLIQGDSSTRYGQKALISGHVLFIDRRIAFDDEPQGARFPSWLVLFGGSRRDVSKLNGLDLGVVL